MIDSPPAAVWRKGVVCLQCKHLQNPQRFQHLQCLEFDLSFPPTCPFITMCKNLSGVVPCHTMVWNHSIQFVLIYESTKGSESNESKVSPDCLKDIVFNVTLWAKDAQYEDTLRISWLIALFRIFKSDDYHSVYLYLLSESWPQDI